MVVGGLSRWTAWGASLPGRRRAAQLCSSMLYRPGAQVLELSWPVWGVSGSVPRQTSIVSRAWTWIQATKSCVRIITVSPLNGGLWIAIEVENKVRPLHVSKFSPAQGLIYLRQAYLKGLPSAQDSTKIHHISSDSLCPVCSYKCYLD